MKRVLFLVFLFFTLLLSAQSNESLNKLDDSSASTETINITNLNSYPNPFTIKTTISFNCSNYQEIILEVKNVLGKRVFFTKINAVEGENSFDICRDNLPVGMYIYTLQSESEAVSKRLVIK